MPNTREKLIELLKESKLCSKRFDDQYSDGTIAIISDHLIANGVTVQEDCKACAEATQSCIFKLQEQIAELRSVRDGEDNNVPTKWISVKDRLPEEMRAVIVWTKDRARGEAWLSEDGFEWCASGERADVTHWMEFPPPPPKGE